jgi:metal-responsive CopG/Arc/MetJ family transcriptional regulator
MGRRLVSLPESLCKKLDSLKAQGYTVSGFIRALLEREFAQPKTTKKGA